MSSTRPPADAAGPIARVARVVMASCTLIVPSGLVAQDAPGVAGASGASFATPGECADPGEFPDATLDDWQQREFEGRSEYALVDEGGRRVLDARTDGAASILYREREVDLAATPRLSWSWRIDGVYDDIDELTKGGDDYPARLYVVVRDGLLPWDTLALNYVWASSRPAGTMWRSPYTDKAVMIAVQSGDERAGAWICETRDVAADFRTAFDRRIETLDGYAVMVDGDNGDRRGAARFGALGFSAGDPVR